MANQEEVLLFEAPAQMLRITNRFIYSGAAWYPLASINSVSIERGKRGLSGRARVIAVLLSSILIANMMLVIVGIVLTAIGSQASANCSSLFCILLLYVGVFVGVERLFARWEARGPYQIYLGTPVGEVALLTSKDLNLILRVQEAVRQAFKDFFGREAEVSVSGGITVIQNPQNSQVVSVWADGSSTVGNISQQR